MIYVNSDLVSFPKSNAAYVVFNVAISDVKDQGSLEIPLHLSNAPTRLMKKFGYGKEYRYAHDEPNAYVLEKIILLKGLQSVNITTLLHED